MQLRPIATRLGLCLSSVVHEILPQKLTGLDSNVYLGTYDHVLLRRNVAPHRVD